MDGLGRRLKGVGVFFCFLSLGCNKEAREYLYCILDFQERISTKLGCADQNEVGNGNGNERLTYIDDGRYEKEGNGRGLIVPTKYYC